jgi:DNA mismatch repair protein MutH
MSSLTLNEILTKVLSLLGKPHACPITKNKGKPGLLLEKITGIPQTSNCLDCSDGELKTVPVVRNKAGKLVPKETIAVTMLNTADLRTNDFKASKCFMKMKRVLVVPYLRNGDNIQFMTPVLIDASQDIYAGIYAELEKDYNAIRSQYIADNTLQSATGNYLQNRTKGAGHGSTSRAFYLRKKFVEDWVPLSL